jgi:hypothetical protein
MTPLRAVILLGASSILAACNNTETVNTTINTTNVEQTNQTQVVNQKKAVTKSTKATTVIIVKEQDKKPASPPVTQDPAPKPPANDGLITPSRVIYQPGAMRPGRWGGW